MDLPDIPEAASKAPSQTSNTTNVDQDLISMVTEKVKQISETKPFVELVIKKQFPRSLIDSLKSKGYVINIYQFFDSTDETYHSRVKIKNPNYSTPGTDFFENMEKQFRDVGFSANSVNFNDNLTNCGFKFADFFKNI